MSMWGEDLSSLMFASVDVRVNGVVLVSVFVEDFFHKYGNRDGHYIPGLVAEAYFVRELWSLGYEVRFVVSHNIEVRWIGKDNIAYDCVADYGKVLDRMPSELKTVVENFCKKGVDINVEDDGNVPVYFEDRLLFRKNFRKLIYGMFSKYRDKYITYAIIIFDREFEPFQAALGIELIHLLGYPFETPLQKLPSNRVEKVLEEVEKILVEKGVRLDKDFWAGLKLSNREELKEELRKLTPPERF